MAAAQAGSKGKGGSGRGAAPKGYKPVKKTNWFAVWVSVAAVVLVVAIAGGVVWMNNAKAGPSAPVVVPSSSGINTDTGAIAVGTGSGTLDTYVDFMCPVCGNFEATYGSTIQSLVEDGKITLNIHPISILDRLSSGTQYSTRAASAMYAVAATRPDLSLAYLQVLFANQPKENSSGLTDDQLIAYAQQVGAGDAADAIRSGTYQSYVASITQKTPIQPGQSGIATPTIAINGEVILNSTLTGDPQKDLVARFS